MNRAMPALRPLWVALLATLAAASTPASSAPPVDAGRPRLRSDAARRIFPALPAPRLGSRTDGVTPRGVHLVGNCHDDGPGSLRAAVAVAASGDTIDLSQLHCSTITLTTGAVEVEVDDLALLGPGASRLALDGNRQDRVFIHPRGGTLTFKGLTLRNGRDRATGFHVAGGGCIASAGYLQVYDSVVRNCYAGGEGSYGGALYAYSLTMANSTLAGNHAHGVHEAAGTAAFGGAAFVYAVQIDDSTISSNLADHAVNPGFSSYDIGGAFVAVTGGTISGSTIDNNVSDGRGGGIAVFNPLVVINSTVSGNVARRNIAGGIFMRWPSALELVSSTVTRNRAALDGGGIWLNAAGSGLRSSIVSGNSTDIGNRDNHYDVPRAVTLLGSHSLVGSTAPLLTVPADTLSVDPQLRPLAFNGGATRTHAPLPTSLVIDHGDNPFALATDQRGAGYARQYGAAPDIGAYEWQGEVAPPATAVPTASRWALGLLAGLLLLAAAAWRRVAR